MWLWGTGMMFVMGGVVLIIGIVYLGDSMFVRTR